GIKDFFSNNRLFFYTNFHRFIFAYAHNFSINIIQAFDYHNNDPVVS
ncbi:37124_t:CDS:1, partial [Gigaspora margarita]